MNIFARLFGSSEVVSKVTDGVISGVDKLFYTDEEKAEDKRVFATQQVKNSIDYINAMSGYKLAQRVLAFMFVGVYLASFFISLATTIYTTDAGSVTAEIIKLVNAFWIGEIVLTITAFYFGSGAIGGAVERIKNSGGVNDISKSGNAGKKDN